MKIVLISTPVFRLTKAGLSGYGGLEHLVAVWAIEMQKLGHEVSVVCPEGSDLGEGIEIIPIGLLEPEEVAYGKYKDRLLSGEFDACMDNSWLWASVFAQAEASKQLPIIHAYHSDPYAGCNPGAPPPIEKPCLLAFSEAQANIMRRLWNCCVRVVHHGIDLDFYKPDPLVQRSNRYLWLARYTPEKGFLEVAYVTKKCRVPLDAFGDTTIVASQDYVTKCFNENDGILCRVNPGISRKETVQQYQSHKALITYPNYIEIFGLVTVEAMATGCPVISKDSGAARELIRHGKTGFVISTLEQLEDLIKQDAVSQIKPEDCVKQARRFSIQKSAAGHLRLLQDAADGFVW